MLLYSKRYFFNLIGLFLGCSIMFSGCSTVEPSASKIVTTIIIKNNTGKFIKKVSISEIRASGRGRHGSISPLPSGTEQIYGRADKAKRLSDTLLVTWVYNKNGVYKKSISIASLLSSSESNIDTTIVLEFTPDNRLNVYKKTHE